MKVILATGGTGGHLFPAIRVAQEFRQGGHDIVLVGSFQRGRPYLVQSGFAFEEIASKGLVTRPFHEMLMSCWIMLGAIIRSFRSLKRLKPDVVIGFGGYGAFPVVLAAAVLRLPVLIHEQNVVPGRANALLARFADKIAISFAQSASFFKECKTVLTGCPCHTRQKQFDRDALFGQFGLNRGKTTILVLGGSQGSRRINEAFTQALKMLKSNLDFQVIHVAGKQDPAILRERYNHFGIPFALFEFLDKMEDAYEIADVIVSRAGAATVSEIAYFRKPAVLIPYPYAQGHQKYNASVLVEAGVAQMLEEADLSASKLADAIGKLANMTVGYDQFHGVAHPDAASRLMKEALQLVC